ncbi:MULTISPECIES: hydrolase [Terrisporobacter]|uniref:Hydrolase n=1 Tax=Terrisporobacter muris TaxID=2963284 RepID=A0A9X2S2W6_9FIRM|nr:MULTISPECIES: hydrolase [Terrisporobacter]MCR1824309.1 hydrolase [Terrisporobacter muris]MDY3373387.1 hydrolase [Terrisporobacter othiniensis]
MKQRPKSIDGTLRKSFLRVPEVIRECSGINIFGKRIKSLVFSTDLAIIKNINADAVIAVYPFTPQPIITQSIIMASDIPVFAGVGGGLTKGIRSVMLGTNAELQGAIGVVVNAPTSNGVVKALSNALDIPVVVTIVNDDTNIQERIDSGATIFNVSASVDTPRIVAKIRDAYPDFPIIATGGPTDESIRKTIAAGANAITWTPPSIAVLFKDVMNSYRQNSDAH